MLSYTFYWFDGKRQVLQGYDPADALNKAGYSVGATRALDFWADGVDNKYTWNSVQRKWESVELRRK